MQLGLANSVVPTGTAVDVAVGLAEQFAELPSQSAIETKALLNAAFRASVDAWLAGAVASEAASFDEPAFQGNLARLLARTTSD